MKTKSTRSILSALILVCALTFAGCNQVGLFQKEIGPEVGKWHAEIPLSDVSDPMSEEDEALMSMLIGNVAFEIDAEFGEDNTFTYVMNMDKLREALSDSVSAFAGILVEFDVSSFTDRLVESIVQDALDSNKHEYAGTYTRSESNFITATDGDTLYFQVNDTSLVQIDEDGNTIAKFSKVS